MTYVIATRATVVTCNVCNFAIDEDPSLQPSVRRVCPNCGSTSRRFAVEMFESVSAFVTVSTILTIAQDRVEGSGELSNHLPRFGELLLFVFLTRAERINIIGDLLEDLMKQRKSSENAPRLGASIFKLLVQSGHFSGDFFLRLVSYRAVSRCSRGPLRPLHD
jgi:hypothetical protein